jgi:hypothetical protein
MGSCRGSTNMDVVGRISGESNQSSPTKTKIRTGSDSGDSLDGKKATTTPMMGGRRRWLSGGEDEVDGFPG